MSRERDERKGIGGFGGGAAPAADGAGAAGMTFYMPELLYADGASRPGAGLLVDLAGRVAGWCGQEAMPEGARAVVLRGKALFPGLANAHSHTFQRLFRGRAEGRAGADSGGRGGDSFWSWREQMYRAAGFVTPEDVYDVSRAVFLEMVSSGITVVGEFHYLHRDRDGRPYSDQNLLGQQVIRAAESVGLRICLLRSAYFRAGFEREPDLGQRRFYERPAEYLRSLEELAAKYVGADGVRVGAAPHSVRAVPLAEIKEIAEVTGKVLGTMVTGGGMPLHLHVSEQLGENEGCVREYGRTPVEMLDGEGVLGERATLIHAIHLTEAEFGLVARARATICSCPTTERNLGDGIFPADRAVRLGIPIAFGSDSQAQMDLLEDARELELNLRLERRERGILDLESGGIGDLLLRSATRNGVRALGFEGGGLAVGEPADFFTADLNDLSVLGMDERELAAQVVFGMGKAAVRDVVVGGRMILENGRHAGAGEIRNRYRAVQRRFCAEVG